MKKISDKYMNDYARRQEERSAKVLAMQQLVTDEQMNAQFHQLREPLVDDTKDANEPA